MVRSRHFRAASALALLMLGFWAAQGCTSSSGRPIITGTGGNSQAGAAGTASGTGGDNVAGMGAGTAGTTSGAGGATGAAGTTGTGGSTGAAGSTGGSTTNDAAAGSSGTDGGATDSGSIPFDAAGRTPPTCKTPVPSPIPAMKPTSECDFLLQSLDFEDMYDYTSPQIEITNYGTALGAYEINKCMPYCYAKELTIGVDIVGGGDPTGLQGEVIVHFPATGPELPIATAIGRDSLAWIQLSGDTAPPFKIMAQLVVESRRQASSPAKTMVQVGYNALAQLPERRGEVLSASRPATRSRRGSTSTS